MSNTLDFCPGADGAARFDEPWQQVQPCPDPAAASLNPALQANFPCLDTPTPELPAAPDEAAFLRERIDRCCADARLYDVLAQRTGQGCVARTCAALACRKRDQARKLQTALYIQTGETYRGGPVCPYVYSAMETLRQQCLEEERSGQLYLDFAAEASPRLAALCTGLATEDNQNACLLERLIDSLIC